MCVVTNLCDLEEFIFFIAIIIIIIFLAMWR